MTLTILCVAATTGPARGAPLNVTSLAWSAQGVVAVGSSHKTVMLLDAATGRVLRRLVGPGPAVTSIPFGGDSATPVTDDIQTMAFSADGKRLATGGQDSTLRLWDVAGGTLERQIADVLITTGLDLSRDGRLLASSSSSSAELDTEVTLWDVRSGKRLAALGGKDNPYSEDVGAVALSPDGRLCAAAGPSLWIWNVAAPSQVPPKLSKVRAYDVAFAPDGQSVAAATRGGIARWKTTGWGALPTLGPPGAYRHVRFTPDGALLCGLDPGNGITLWDARSGRRLRSIPGPFSAIATGPARMLIAGDAAGRIRIWNALSGRLLHTWTLKRPRAP